VTEVLGELELQFAKARFAEDYNCVSVRLTEGGTGEDARRSIALCGFACFVGGGKRSRCIIPRCFRMASTPVEGERMFNSVVESSEARAALYILMAAIAGSIIMTLLASLH